MAQLDCPWLRADLRRGKVMAINNVNLNSELCYEIGEHILDYSLEPRGTENAHNRLHSRRQRQTILLKPTSR